MDMAESRRGHGLLGRANMYTNGQKQKRAAAFTFWKKVLGMVYHASETCLYVFCCQTCFEIMSGSSEKRQLSALLYGCTYTCVYE
jgi:hypothetical protein